MYRAARSDSEELENKEYGIAKNATEEVVNVIQRAGPSLFGESEQKIRDDCAGFFGTLDKVQERVDDLQN